jgi:hypothetical protein
MRLKRQLRGIACIGARVFSARQPRARNQSRFLGDIANLPAMILLAFFNDSRCSAIVIVDRLDRIFIFISIRINGIQETKQDAGYGQVGT